MSRAAPASLRPTRFGALFLLLILLTLIGCVNYSLSLGYALTFLLGGVWVAGASQVARAGRGLRAALSAPTGAVAGGEAVYRLRLHAGERSALVGVTLRSTHGDRRRVGAQVAAGASLELPVPFPARVRGELDLARLEVRVHDPLGLWQTPVRPEVTPAAVPVAPAPESGAPPAPARRAATDAEDGTLRARGDEDFAGLRPYAAGDSPRQVAWRHVARTGRLLTRETDAAAGRAWVLAWADSVGADTEATSTAPGDLEARLSRLAAWVEEAHAAGVPFALILPDGALPPGQGEAQVREARRRLSRVVPWPTPPRAARPVPGPLPAPAMRATLVALAVALLPLALRQPWWATLLGAGLLAHTWARLSRPLPAIPTWLLGLLAGLSLAFLNASFGTLLGAEAGTALLGTLLALKAAESRRPRDGHVLVLLGLFLTSTHFFLDQGPLSALHVLAASALLLSAAGGWLVTAGPAPTLAGRLRPALRLMALATPLAAALFVLFPRPQGPLWQLPVQSRPTTGLANEIRAGEFSDLAQSGAVAFRADFAGPVPAPEQRYWRGPLYETYDGVSWTQVLRAPGRPPSFEPSGPAWRYTLTLEPTPASQIPWVPALDAPATVLEGRAFLTAGFQAIAQRSLNTRVRFTLQSAPARLGRQEDERRLERNLGLPEGQSPRAVALAASWRTRSPEQRVQAGLAYLAQGAFSYTLSPPLLPEQDRVDAFLYTSRAGFCEHYASAFAFLMRAAGLPARIVGGYLGGEVNPDGGYLIVRQRDAHAWTEVWLPGQGWTRVDPTAVVAPARVSADVGTALTSPRAATARPPTLWRRLSLRADALQNRWNDLVVGYDGPRQAEVLARLGVGAVGSSSYLLAAPLLLTLALLPALLRRPRRPRDPAARALHDLSTHLRLPRDPAETPTAYAARVRGAHPGLAAALDDFVRAYHAARYAQGDPAPHLRAMQAALRRVKRGGG